MGPVRDLIRRLTPNAGNGVLKRGPSGADTIIFRRGEQIMVTTYTDAGTPIIDMSDDEYRAFLDHEVRERIGLSLEEFVARANAGEIDWDHPEAFALAGLVGVGESGLIASASSNGHRPAA